MLFLPFLIDTKTVSYIRQTVKTNDVLPPLPHDCIVWHPCQQ